MGLPKHLKDDDVHCEYPADADDEYVTERGFQPTLPGESTKLSSALALFRAARILSKVLEEVVPAKTSYDLSLKKLAELSDELDAWNASLAPHLRLQFVQDKPSTGTVSSRSPLLSLTYHYIRALIQRPAICASLGNRSSSSMMILASSCKHMVQIIQLLDERGMCFSFCLNKDEVLVLSGFGLLFQGLSLEPISKILKDNHKTLTAVVGILAKSQAPCSTEFGNVARSFLPAPAVQPVLPTTHKPRTMSLSRPEPIVPVNPIASLPASTRKQLKAIASRFTTSTSKPPKLDVADHRRATVHSISLHPHGTPSQSRLSLQAPSAYQPSSMSRSEPARSPMNLYGKPPLVTRPSAPPQLKPKPRLHPHKALNLDYLSFGNDSESVPAAKAAMPAPVKSEPQPTDWERLLGSLDNGSTNIYDACYGGQPVEALFDSPTAVLQKTNSTTTLGDDSIAWYVYVPPNRSLTYVDILGRHDDLWALCQTDTNTSGSSGFSISNGHPASVLSFSTDEGGVSSSDDLAGDWQAGDGRRSGDAYKGIVMPAELHHSDSGEYGSWDEALGL